MYSKDKLLRVIFSESHENIVGIAVNTETEVISIHFRNKRVNDEISATVGKLTQAFGLNPDTVRTRITSFPLVRKECVNRFTISN